MSKVFMTNSLEYIEYYRDIVSSFNTQYGNNILEVIEDGEKKVFRIVLNENLALDLDYKELFEDMEASFRYANPDNPYDKKYPFLREDFVEEYEASKKFGVTYSEYRKGFIEGKYIEPSDIESVFIKGEPIPEEKKMSRIIQPGDGCGLNHYYDSDGTLERTYRVPSETIGLASMGRLFFEKNMEGYKILVDKLNEQNGEDFAKILGDEKNGYMIYLNPEGAGSKEFSDRFLMLENVIALDYHPELSKAEVLSYIHSDEDRATYMQNPSRKLLLEILDKQKELEVEKEKGAEIVSGDIAKLAKEKEITSKELAPVKEKGIKAFIRKMINKIKGIGE